MSKNWSILGIQPTEEIKAIKRAYAAKLRECHPEDHPEEFQQLRQAYEAILDELKHAASRPVFRAVIGAGPGAGYKTAGGSDTESEDGDEDGTDEPYEAEHNIEISLADEFMDQVDRIYNDYFKRIDLGTWRDLFEDERYWAVDTRKITRSGMIYFLSGDVQLPHEIWNYLDSQLTLLGDDIERYWSVKTIKRMTALIRITNELRYDSFDPERKDTDFGLYVSHRDNAFFSLAQNDSEEAEFHLDRAYSIYQGDGDLKRLIAIHLANQWDADEAFEIFQGYGVTELNKKAFEQLRIYIDEFRQMIAYIEEKDILSVIFLNQLIAIIQTGEINGSRKKTYELLLARDQADRYSSRQEIARALHEAGKYAEAVDLFDEILRLEPDDNQALFHKAMSLFHLARHREALELYDRILASPDTRTDIDGIWNNKGWTYLRLDMYTEAASCFGKAIEYNGQASTYWINKAEALYRAKRYKTVLRHIDTALELWPENANAWYIKGMALRQLENYQEALNCFETMFRYGQNEDRYWKNKAYILEKLERYEEAIECFDVILEKDPLDDSIWDDKGNALYCLERYEEAVESFDRVLTLRSNYVRGWYLKGVSLKRIGLYEKALACFYMAIHYETSEIYLGEAGDTLHLLNRYEEAIEQYDKALKSNPEYVTAWVGKAEAYVELGEPQAAEDCLNKAKACAGKF